MHDIRILARLTATLAALALTALVSVTGQAAPVTTPASLAEAARASASSAAAKVWQGAQDVALFALGMIGVDYKFGGNTPDAGLDCSGLIRYVFQEVTGTTLPRTAKEMARLGSKVSVADLAPGDLVFFNTRRFAYSHVGLYLGDNRFIHAPSAGGEVEVATLSQHYWQQHFDGARRLVGVLPSLVPTLITTAVAAPVQAIVPAVPVAAASAAAVPPATLAPSSDGQ